METRAANSYSHNGESLWITTLNSYERITPGTNKRTHKPIDRADEATDSQWREAYALAALRLLAEQRDGLVSDIRRLCEYAHLEHGTSALRLAEVAHVSNGSTARWLREPMWSEFYSSERGDDDA